MADFGKVVELRYQ